MIRFGWPTITSVVGVVGTLIGGLTGGYIENLRVEQALDGVNKRLAEEKPIFEQMQTEVVLDAVQQEQIKELQAAMLDLKKTNEEIRNWLRHRQ